MTAVAVLCDQYDCVHLVAPWLDGWIAGLRKFKDPDESPGVQDAE